MFRRLHREERGDIIVTPAIMILLGVTVLLLGAATYLGGKAAGSKVGGASQGLKIDDNGNVVEGAVGVIPVPTPTKAPDETPHTTVIDQNVYQTADPAQSTPDNGGIVAVNPGGDGGVTQGTSSSSNNSSSSTDNNSTPEPSPTHHSGCGGC